MSSIVNKVKDALNPDKNHGSDSNNSESHNTSQRTNEQYDDPSNPRVGGAQQQHGAVGSGRNTRSSAAAAGGLDEFSSAGGAGYNTNAASHSNTGRVGPGAAGNLNAANSGLDSSSDPTFASSGRGTQTAGSGVGGSGLNDSSDPTFASSGRVGGANAARTGGNYDNVGNVGHNNPDDWSGAQGQTGSRVAGNTGNNPSDWDGVRRSDDPTFASSGRTGAASAGNTGIGGHRDLGGDVRQQAANSQQSANSQQGGLRGTVEDIKDSFGGNRGGASGNNYPTSARDPTDASQVPPSVLAKHIGEPTVDHGDISHNRARRNSSATHQESFSGI